MANTKWQIVLVVHNVRSAHNVGSILRTADGFGVDHVYLSGYTPYPQQKNDERLPHLASKIDRQIHKTALGAENTVAWTHIQDIEALIDKLRDDNFQIAALEQTESAVPLNEFKADQNIALIVGNEVDGVDSKTLELADVHLHIPMHGQKESFNVAIAASIAMYHLTV